MGSLEEQFVDCGGYATHLYVATHRSQSRGPLLLVLPGNPGVASFYLSFAGVISQRLPHARLAIVGHSGHFVNPDQENTRYVGLEEQAKHKAAVLDHLNAEVYPGCLKSGTVLLAHSIGSWISMELRELRPDLDIRIFHLCPTFRHLYEGFSWGVKLATVPGVSWFLANVIHYLPNRVRKALIWLAGHADTDEILLVAEDHVDFYCVRNILHMAAEEAVIVRETRPAHLEQMRKGRDFFYFSQIDHYVPLRYVDDLKRCVDNIDCVIAEKDVEHAFVLRHAEHVAEVCLTRLEPIFAHFVPEKMQMK